MLPDTSDTPDTSGAPSASVPGYHVCFVCTGNICRSPMAESVLRARLDEEVAAGVVTVSSAGTGGWHEGDPADHRAVAVLAAAGYGSAHTARRFLPAMFAETDLVIALDRGHERELRRIAPTPADAAKVRLLRSYDPTAEAEGGLDVADPYYGGREDFEAVLTRIEAAVPALLAAVREAAGGRPGPTGDRVPEQSTADVPRLRTSRERNAHSE